jgi:hypothetical protein
VAKEETATDSSFELIPLMPDDAEERQLLLTRMAAGEYAKCPQLNCKAFDKNCTKYKHRDGVTSTSCANPVCSEQDFDLCCVVIVQPTPAPTPEPTARASTTQKPPFSMFGLKFR